MILPLKRRRYRRRIYRMYNMCVLVRFLYVHTRSTYSCSQPPIHFSVFFPSFFISNSTAWSEDRETLIPSPMTSISIGDQDAETLLVPKCEPAHKGIENEPAMLPSVAGHDTGSKFLESQKCPSGLFSPLQRSDPKYRTSNSVSLTQLDACSFL